MTDLPLTGGCNCGAVRFEMTEEPAVAGYCHCGRCQRRTGTSASAQVYCGPRSVRILAGEERLRFWKPADGAEKWFCGDCGSALFAHRPHGEEGGAVRLGAFDRDPGVRPSFHQFVAYAAAWEPIPEDGLDRYPERRPSP
jgi:hypothetical protein